MAERAIWRLDPSHTLLGRAGRAQTLPTPARLNESADCQLRPEPN